MLPFDPIVGHLVADYLLQNDFLAQGKKKSDWICAVHCLIWTLCVFLFGRCWRLSPPDAFLMLACLFASHFVQDRWDLVQRWMKLIGQEGFMAPPRLDTAEGLLGLKLVPGLGPWSVIVVDNVLHIVVIWALWQVLM